MSFDAKHLPLDPQAVARLAERGLDLRLLDSADAPALHHFVEAIRRGFLDTEPTPEQLRGVAEVIAPNRLLGVYDGHGADPATPVGTIESWLGELSLPGGSTVPLWAISAVTVAATHRRRGIARAFLEGELRTALAAGAPVAGLTVSEATIYGRYGFGPAVHAATWLIDAARAGWAGPEPAGRLDFVPREQLPAELAALHERIRPRRPGDVRVSGLQWRSVAGLIGAADDAAQRRAVRYRDEDGHTRGVLVYRLESDSEDFAKHTLHVRLLLGETPEADAALWRFALQHDLVSTVRAWRRLVDEPLRWLLADPRAATVTVHDDHWLRILDVPAALGARRFAAAGDFVFAVDDPLGIVDGGWLLEIDDEGRAEVAASAAEPTVRLGVSALSSLLLGGTQARTLAAAGRIRADDAVLRQLDAAFAPEAPPQLTLGY